MSEWKPIEMGISMMENAIWKRPDFSGSNFIEARKFVKLRGKKRGELEAYVIYRKYDNGVEYTWPDIEDHNLSAAAYDEYLDIPEPRTTSPDLISLTEEQLIMVMGHVAGLRGLDQEVQDAIAEARKLSEGNKE